MIIFRIDWRMQVVNPKHFIDHFVRILPKFNQLPFSSPNKTYDRANSPISTSSTNSYIASSKMRSLQKALNEEIEDCIDSIAKLSPLVPDYIGKQLLDILIALRISKFLTMLIIEYSSSEVATASLIIATKHSLKSLSMSARGETSRLSTLKAVYLKWITATYTKYNISKAKIQQFSIFIQDFLAKVCEQK